MERYGEGERKGVERGKGERVWERGGGEGRGVVRLLNPHRFAECSGTTSTITTGRYWYVSSSEFDSPNHHHVRV